MKSEPTLSKLSRPIGAHSIDDSPPIREMVCRGLRFAGFHVVEAAHVADALRLLDEGHEMPAAVVTDVEMPGPSVRVLIDAMQRARVPVLLIGGDVSEPAVRGVIERGEVDLLRKPFSWDELIRGVRHALLTRTFKR